MKTIIHLSDLHFGKVDHTRINPLLNHISTINPDMVVISGDLTQRATEAEYKEARKFLKKIKQRVFIIPGNHDIPLFNIMRRIITPFKRYIKYITPNLSPFYADKDIAVIGINSVRRLTITSGKIDKKQLKTAENLLDKLDSDIVKIVVCHHPLDIPQTINTHHKHTHKVISGSKLAMTRLAEKKVDLFLTGHLHVSHVGDTTARYKIKDYSGLIIQAGTAISKRSRGEAVSFNVLHINQTKIKIEKYAGSTENYDYNLVSTHVFEKGSQGWKVMKRTNL